MHILGLLLAAIAGVGVLLWRLNAASDAAKGLAETAGEVNGFFRRRKWQNKLLNDPVQSVDDPRLAAAAMMVALAQNDGALTEREHITISEQLRDRFNAQPPQNEELLAHARWVVSNQSDIDTTLRKLFNVIRAKCGPKEITETFEMLNAVANANGRTGDMERRAIETLRKISRT